MKKKRVEVKFLIDQSTEHGDFEKGNKLVIDEGTALIWEGRGIVEITKTKRVKNGG